MLLKMKANVHAEDAVGWDSLMSVSSLFYIRLGTMNSQWVCLTLFFCVGCEHREYPIVSNVVAPQSINSAYGKGWDVPTHGCMSARYGMVHCTCTHCMFFAR